MKIYPDKLSAHLAKGALPSYLIHGDEPLQSMEIGDSIRAYASSEGYAERQVLFPVKDDDWADFREATDCMSLFSDKRLIELRLPTGKPGRLGSEVIKQYCENPAPDVLLLVTSAKLDRSGTSSAWFKALDKVGVTIGVWPVAANQLGAWLSARLAKHGLQASPEAIALIAERVEGNLLAASQEIERLALLYPEGELSADAVLSAVANSARYSITDLVQAALNGQTQRAVRILQGLRDEATAPTLLLWALSQEIRSGARTAEACERGQNVDAALKSAGVWQSRAAPLKKALLRHNSNSWLSMLSTCTYLDRLVKGHAAGDVWDTFDLLCVRMAGKHNAKLPVGSVSTF